MSDLLEEVDEIMRQERMIALWKQHGNTFIGVIVAIILGTALVSGYKAWDENTRHNDTAQLVALTESPDFPANIKDAKLDMRPGLKGIAILNAAGTLAAEGKQEEARTLFDQASNDKSIPDQIRDLAILSTVRLKGEETSAQVKEKLKSVWSNKNSMWRYQARLEAAVIEAADKNYAVAREHLNVILDAPALPETLYNKARTLEKIYALKQYKQDGSNNASKS